MKRYKFDPREILHPHSAGLEGLLAFKDDPADDDGGGKSDHNSGDDDASTGEKSQGELDLPGENPAPSGSSPGESAKLKALEKKLAKEKAAREKLEAERKAAEDAKKSELEKAQDAAKLEREKREQAEKNVRELKVESAIRTAIVSAGVRGERLEAALRLVDRSAITLEDDGVDGAEEAVEALKKEFPEFFGTKSTSSPGTGGGKGGDRGGDDDGPQSDYEVGQALAKQRKQTKSRL